MYIYTLSIIAVGVTTLAMYTVLLPISNIWSFTLFFSSQLDSLMKIQTFRQIKKHSFKITEAIFYIKIPYIILTKNNNISRNQSEHAHCTPLLIYLHIQINILCKLYESSLLPSPLTRSILIPCFLARCKCRLLIPIYLFLQYL